MVEQLTQFLVTFAATCAIGAPTILIISWVNERPKGQNTTRM